MKMLEKMNPGQMLRFSLSTATAVRMPLGGGPVSYIS